MLIGTDSFTLTAWDWANRRRLTRIPLRDRAYGLVVSRKSDRAAVWTMSGVQVYSMQSAEMVMELSAGMGLPVMAFDSVTDAIAIAERNGVRIYDASGQELSNHPIDSRSILSLAFSPGGSELSIGCSDSLVRTLQI